MIAVPLFVLGPAEPFYLTEMDVFLGADRVSPFRMTPVVSDNPLVTFRLKAYQDGLLRVAFRDNRGARLEAGHLLRLG